MKRSNQSSVKSCGFFRKLFAMDSTKSIIASLICILGGFIVGLIVLILLAAFSNDIPLGEAFEGIAIILGGPFSGGSVGDILFTFGDMILKSAPLMMTGLSVAVAFKTGLFNIGAPGQYLIGSAVSLLIALSMPTPQNGFSACLIWLLAFVAAIAAGMLWGAIPGFFKAKFNVNEVIVCIMTNWIAANLVSWIFKGSRFINHAETKSNFIMPTKKNGIETLKLGLDKLFPGSNIDISIFIAILFAVVMYIIINKTTFGFELKACGFNKNAAKYAGMNEKRNIVLSMAIAGGLSAAGAALWYLNGSNDLLWDTYNKLPAIGFNGIPTALLASNNPIGVIFTSIFLNHLDAGGFNLQSTQFNEYVSDLIVAVIIYFAGFSKFICGLLGRIKKPMPHELSTVSDTQEDEK